jgi:hypothetical protein
MPHVTESELTSWSDMAAAARSQCQKCVSTLKKIEQTLLTLDAQATAAAEPTLLTQAEEEELAAVREVERETQ